MELKVTVLDKAIMWAPIERARADHEYALRAAGQLQPGEFVAIKSHRIQQVSPGGKQAYDIYVTLEVQMGPGHPEPAPAPMQATPNYPVPPGTAQVLAGLKET